jgi:ribosomal protein S18 acetylase RimI-like enzyme
MGVLNNDGNSFDFIELKWDTDFFGINCAKAILYKPLLLDEWNDLKELFKPYQFVSIENRNSEPLNAQLIGKDTKAFLADVNIQFSKKLIDKYVIPESVTVHRALEHNEQIIDLAEFYYSKFVEDPELAKRGGSQVYKQWLTNSFGKSDKFFVLSKNEKGDVNGFLLFSYQCNECVIELIAVSKNAANEGIGAKLFKAAESDSYGYGCDEIKVGTQVRNLKAVNFYHKVGCKQVGCHQIYHLWKN